MCARQAVVALLCLVAAVPATAAARPVTLESLLRDLVNRDAVARWPSPTYVSHQASSYDRRSKVPADPEGWFANNDWSQFVRSEVNHGRREWVLMDADGPGCVTRIWWGGMIPPKDRRLRFYLDGSDQPAIEGEAYSLLAGGALVPRPLSIENAHGAPGAPGGMNLFLPIPFARHCKITLDDANPKDPAAPPDSRWYNIEYRAYAPATPVQTFTMAALDAARPLVEEVCRTLDGPPAVSGGRTVELPAAAIAPEQEVALDLPRGPGAVRLLEARITGGNDADTARALRSTVVRMEFDGEATVWCPAGDFFGSGAGLNPLQSWYRTVATDGALTCRWVMPYRKSCRVLLANVGTQSVTVTLRATVGPWRWDGRSMHFHASWRSQHDLPTRPMSDWTYLSAEGRGVYVGDTLTVWNPVSAWWGEGDEKVWVDGEPFPSHFGTGSEDYYGYSWGDTHLFQGPFSSQVRCDGPGNKGYTVVTRTRCLDAIPFTRSLRFDMEVWHWADCREDYAAATYWYALPGAKHDRAPQPEEAARPLRQPPAVFRIPGAIECETMKVLAQSPGVEVGTQDGGLSEGEWSGGRHLFVRAKRPGDFVELAIPAPGAGPRRVTVYATKSWDYGILRFSLNGRPVARPFDGYSKTAVASGPIDLGTPESVDGRIVLRVEVVGANAQATGARAYFGLDCVTLGKP